MVDVGFGRFQQVFFGGGGGRLCFVYYDGLAKAACRFGAAATAAKSVVVDVG